MRELDAGLVGLVVGLIGAGIGYVVRGARESEQLSTLRGDHAELKARVSALESGQGKMAVQLAKIEITTDTMSETLARLATMLDRKADKA